MPVAEEFALGVLPYSGLEQIGRAHDVSVATIALAWLRRQPTVVAPIASASRTGQLDGLLASTRVQLGADELAALDAASSRVAAGA